MEINENPKMYWNGILWDITGIATGGTSIVEWHIKNDDIHVTLEDKNRWNNMQGVKFVIVETLPVSGDSGTIYLVPSTTTGETESIYDEYVWINSKWEKIGSAKVDISRKMDKVSGATIGNLVIFASGGTVADSGKKVVVSIQESGSASDDNIATEKAIRTELDNELTKIESVSAKTEENLYKINNLSGSVANEVTARTVGDLVLSGLVYYEENARIAGDATLSGLVFTEISARTIADDNLNVRIVELSGRVIDDEEKLEIVSAKTITNSENINELSVKSTLNTSKIYELSGSVISDIEKLEKVSAITAANSIAIVSLSGNSHTHDNYEVLSGITSQNVTDWNDKQELLISGQNIKTINGNVLLGSGNTIITTYQSFPIVTYSGETHSWSDTKETLKDLIDEISKDEYSEYRKQGMAYLGTISGGCTPFGYGNAECKVEFISDTVEILSINSADMFPYSWQYNSYSAYESGEYKWKSNIIFADVNSLPSDANENVIYRKMKSSILSGWTRYAVSSSYSTAITVAEDGLYSGGTFSNWSSVTNTWTSKWSDKFVTSSSGTIVKSTAGNVRYYKDAYEFELYIYCHGHWYSIGTFVS